MCSKEPPTTRQAEVAIVTSQSKHNALFAIQIKTAWHYNRYNENDGTKALLCHLVVNVGQFYELVDIISNKRNIPHTTARFWHRSERRYLRGNGRAARLSSTGEGAITMILNFSAHLVAVGAGGVDAADVIGGHTFGLVQVQRRRPRGPGDAIFGAQLLPSLAQVRRWKRRALWRKNAESAIGCRKKSLERIKSWPQRYISQENDHRFKDTTADANNGRAIKDKNYSFFFLVDCSTVTRLYKSKQIVFQAWGTFDFAFLLSRSIITTHFSLFLPTSSKLSHAFYRSTVRVNKKFAVFPLKQDPVGFIGVIAIKTLAKIAIDHVPANYELYVFDTHSVLERGVLRMSLEATHFSE